MSEKELLEFHALLVKKYNCLNEVYDLTCQLGECFDRNDSVAVRMVMRMRRDPILKLGELKEIWDEKFGTLSQEGVEYLTDLADLAKGQKFTLEAEKAYYKKAISTKKLNEKVIELDKRLNQRITGDKSVYHK